MKIDPFMRENTEINKCAESIDIDLLRLCYIMIKLTTHHYVGLS